jgi:hypothetical protein
MVWAKTGSCRIVALAWAMTAAACGGDPVAIEFEVIEETTLAASLGVDLGAMHALGGHPADPWVWR